MIDIVQREKLVWLFAAMVIIAVQGCDDGASPRRTPTPGSSPSSTMAPTNTNTPLPPTTAVPTDTQVPATPEPTPTAVQQCFDTTVDASLCDPDVATFTLESTNPYYPLTPGLRVVLEGEEDGEVERVERTVLEETAVIAGVETHVLEHKAFIDGEIHEVARNFYVEATDGTVCYFGEDVEFFEDGELVDMQGTWRVGVNGAKPGVIMPADPKVGDAYFQENAPGIANDMGRVSAVGVSRTIGGNSYEDLVVIQDSNPMEDCDSEEEKVYVAGIGEIVDSFLSIIEASDKQCFDTTVDASLCDPDVATFTLESTNPYYPLTPGLRVVLEGEEDGEVERVERTVLEETAVIAGVETHVLEHKAFIDGEIHEVARNFYVEATDGTVCYFGEDVEFFEDGELVDMQGTWRVGVNGAKPGVIMPADPKVGDAYFQENAPGIANDMGRVSAVGVSRTIGGNSYEDLVVIQDSNPMEDCDSEEEKVYVAGIGEIVDDFLSIIDETDGPVLTAGKLLIEHNSTDEDTGFQGFADGDPWNELVLVGSDDSRIATVAAEGGLFDFGLTELFFETSEPENAEVPIEDVLARLAEGTYSMIGDLVDSEDDARVVIFTHDIPAGPELVSPEEGASGLDPSSVVVSWQPVEEDLDGEDIEIVAYQVIVEEDAAPEFPHGFARPVFSVYLSEEATSVAVPNGFLQDDSCYKWEVLAIEESGNQTLSSSEFETGAGCVPAEEPGEEEPRMTQAKLLIEHNATDEDTGFQGFVDGDPWNEMTISGPGETTIVRVRPEGSLLNFGLTELFFETSEPENAEVPIDDVLARLAEGTYTVRGLMVDGGESTLTTTFSYRIPAAPVLVGPEDGAEEVDPMNTIVTWEPVTTDLDGGPVTIAGYQVIVEVDDDPGFPQGFAHPVFSIYLPAASTSVTVPAEFMEAGTDYAYEVLAIEESGNQTLASAEFATAE